MDYFLFLHLLNQNNASYFILDAHIYIHLNPSVVFDFHCINISCFYCYIAAHGTTIVESGHCVFFAPFAASRRDQCVMELLQCPIFIPSCLSLPRSPQWLIVYPSMPCLRWTSRRKLRAWVVGGPDNLPPSLVRITIPLWGVKVNLDPLTPSWNDEPEWCKWQRLPSG